MFACIYVLNLSGDAQGTLLDCASVFSPRVENTAPGTVVFDLEGLERLFGSYSEIAEQVAEQVRVRGIQANIAVASNPDAAICAARGFAGITVLNRGTEAKRFSGLPLDVLSLSSELLETLERWGIRTFGAFAKLPAVQVSERFGQEGVRLHKLARGVWTRPLEAHPEAFRFLELLDLDYEISTIEPLTFILSRLLDQICSRLRSLNLATHEVHLTLESYVRILRLPLPVRNPRLLTKLLILDLEAHPPGISIKQIKVEAIPAKPRVVQNGLFVPLSPEPEKLELTLARISAVVGEENVGSPEVLDTHRPDAFKVTRFELTVRRTVFPSSQRRGGCASRECREASFESADGVVRNDTISQNDHPGASRHPSFSRRGISFPSSLALRLFRPPLDATVQLKNSLPTWIAFRGVHGPIETVSGPWRTSGDWWRPNTWDREEWDIELLDSLYRIYYDVHTGRWFAQGVYD